MFALLPTPSPKRMPSGRDGLEVELRSDGSYIQWRYKGYRQWNNIISVKELIGPRGQTGQIGSRGEAGPKGASGEKGDRGEKGEKGDRGLQGVQGEIGPAGPRGLIGKSGTNGIDGLDGKDGKDGRPIELRLSKTHVQWRYIGEIIWKDLIKIESLRGPQGPRGDRGERGERGERGLQGYAGGPGQRGPQGFTGATGPSGPGVASGGTAGQVLTKQSDDDFDTDWEDPSGGVWGSITGTLSSQTDLQSALNLKANTSSLATVATSGNYNDLTSKPTIPAQFNPVAGTNVTLSGSYPNITFNASGGASFTSDTKANILISTPAAGTYAISTDTEELFFYDGTNWKVHPIKVSTELANPDAGYTQDSDKRGYGDDYIYGKKLYATGIGDFTDTPYEGAIKVDQDFTPAKYQIYLRGKWNTLFYDLTMENGDFEHVPQTYSIDVRSGNSNTTGLNGQPIIREYKVDAGAYPRPAVIDGGILA